MRLWCEVTFRLSALRRSNAVILYDSRQVLCRNCIFIANGAKQLRINILPSDNLLLHKAILQPPAAFIECRWDGRKVLGGSRGREGKPLHDCAEAVEFAVSAVLSDCNSSEEAEQPK